MVSIEIPSKTEWSKIYSCLSDFKTLRIPRQNEVAYGMSTRPK